MKPLKLKCMLLSEDGETWIVIRQFYAVDLQSNTILDGLELAGMKLKTISKPGETDVGRNSKQGS
ncbi:MAG TPA: hypothetical protein VMW46_12115 [Candidatus Desulfaltia sp.]|nr:hypothetical protein [Candidatus Desulfaltia sp.]